jgi:hypothetical protein
VPLLNLHLPNSCAAVYVCKRSAKLAIIRKEEDMAERCLSQRCDQVKVGKGMKGCFTQQDVLQLYRPRLRQEHLKLQFHACSDSMVLRKLDVFIGPPSST